uniref:Protein kinase domain-containing protein n=1 Tax=Chromera velia CCMP2878 TaxID=1169474 RepID=A0A0G4H6X7_9ALVE|eukprot:Cvel_5774.t1-p1 / transcript=Cvel_5774.t1 / gene=Cvel_5774 / organism=Chromera_velia_CCMP2878 / gene_product=G2-specific protein kinase fin1, putative / transcript_product=G2-specific protein kinase fin1, putative / location=Cvel_scaffold274:71989-72506(-) / protein_length=92 / sequence_SO=supercontig / SO=protein_coding / is_pseudo=false
MVKVSNFGLIQCLDNDREGSFTKMTGTTNCMAPEVRNGKYAAPSDLWSLGCLLFELFMGRCLFAHQVPSVTELKRSKWDDNDAFSAPNMAAG